MSCLRSVVGCCVLVVCLLFVVFVCDRCSALFVAMFVCCVLIVVCCCLLLGVAVVCSVLCGVRCASVSVVVCCLTVVRSFAWFNVCCLMCVGVRCPLLVVGCWLLFVFSLMPVVRYLLFVGVRCVLRCLWWFVSGCCKMWFALRVVCCLFLGCFLDVCLLSVVDVCCLFVCRCVLFVVYCLLLCVVCCLMFVVVYCSVFVTVCCHSSCVVC